ncbi:MAG: efflux RND transporter periplasmic adaptor subunit [Verrucomicrobiota bacterium]
MKKLILSLVLALVATGCGKQNQFVAPQPPEVEVQNPIIEDTTVFTEFAGRTEAASRVLIQARVKGFLKSIEFQEGQFVEEGDLLFTIEPEQFEAAVRTAEGNQAKAKADLEIAIANYKRRKQASATGAVSELDVLAAEADQKAAEAAVSIAEANVMDAKRDLSYTGIHAPMSGRISDSRVDQGNLVGVDATLLTEIVSVKPTYVNVEFSERDILPYLQFMPNETNPEGVRRQDRPEALLDLELVLSDGRSHDEVGHFDFIDNTVDPESGTIRARALFPNKEGALADGLFGRLRVPETVENAVKIPSNVIQRDLGGSFVMLVGPENKIIRRSVTPSRYSEGTLKIIEEYDEEANTGIRPDEKVVVSNLQRAREGLVVNPVEAGSEQPAAADAVPEAEDKPEPEGAEDDSEKEKG